MTDAVRDSYDTLASRYARLALDELDRSPVDRAWLETFAEAADGGAGRVADLGCGPGHVVNHLAALGVAATGFDISPGLIAEARHAFPDLRFELGDLASLDFADDSLGGIVSRYSLIHLQPGRLPAIFDEWRRALAPGAPVLVSFFAAPSGEAHGTPFDHAVITAYALFPDTVAEQLRGAGFGRIETGTRPPRDGERQLDHGTILARTPGA